MFLIINFSTLFAFLFLLKAIFNLAILEAIKLSSYISIFSGRLPVKFSMILFSVTGVLIFCKNIIKSLNCL